MGYVDFLRFGPEKVLPGSDCPFGSRVTSINDCKKALPWG
jgi:hypothetical protein